MQKYRVDIALKRIMNYGERQPILIKKFFTISNKIVELGGTIDIPRDFELKYINRQMIVKFDKKFFNILMKMPEIADIRSF